MSNLRIISKEELKVILDKHMKWLINEAGGECANLRSADLSSADLSFTNLSFANLSFANLSFANLRSANLSFANLSFANLSSADLRSADLVVFQFNRHTGYFTFDGKIRIGCHNLSISEWLERYKVVGNREKYTELEIKVYGYWIKLCSKLQAIKDKERAKKNK